MSERMAVLLNGVGVVGFERRLHRVGRSFDMGKRPREIAGSIRIRAWVLLKSGSPPSRY